jgi:hypothetical protein
MEQLDVRKAYSLEGYRAAAKVKLHSRGHPAEAVWSALCTKQLLEGWR